MIHRSQYANASEADIRSFVPTQKLARLVTILQNAEWMYAPLVEQLAIRVLRPTSRRVKFKLGQQCPAPMRREIATRLRRRGKTLDLRTAAIIESLLDGRLMALRPALTNSDELYSRLQSGA